jgi:hypothetical protein
VLEDKKGQQLHHDLIALMGYHEDGRVEELTAKAKADGTLDWDQE